MGKVLLAGIPETGQSDVERGCQMKQIGGEGCKLALYGGHSGQGQPALGIQKKWDAGNGSDGIRVAVLRGRLWSKQQMLDSTAVQMTG